MYAIIETGGKQYMVSPGDKLKVEKLNLNEGELVEFKPILVRKENGEVVLQGGWCGKV
jgi:large subunit ribosomal protein L21